MTSNQDEASRWLARSLGWEQSLERIRHAALADAATAGRPEAVSEVDEPAVVLEPAAGSDREPVGAGEERAQARRRAETRRHAHPRTGGVVVSGEGTRAGVRRSA